MKRFIRHLCVVLFIVTALAFSATGSFAAPTDPSGGGNGPCGHSNDPKCQAPEAPSPILMPLVGLVVVAGAGAFVFTRSRRPLRPISEAKR